VEESGADKSAPLVARGRERRVSGCERAPIGGGHLSGRAGLFWAEMVFSIFVEFLIAFLFFLYGFLKWK
jgi:hypothetical protein